MVRLSSRVGRSIPPVTGGLDEWSSSHGPTWFGLGNRTRLMACSNTPFVSFIMESDLPVLPEFTSPGTIFIIGAGRFGSRAAKILGCRQESIVWLFEKDREALAHTKARLLHGIHGDGIRFLVENFSHLHPSSVIVPAVPLHLAWEWLKNHCGENTLVQTDVPKEIHSLLPHTWTEPKGSVLVSYADFLCPEDCPEPERVCTVTGRSRGLPLFQRIGELEVEEFNLHVIRSRQWGPGVGGYTVSDLAQLLNRVKSHPKGRWLVATACRCHGVITALKADLPLTPS